MSDPLYSEGSDDAVEPNAAEGVEADISSAVPSDGSNAASEVM